FNRGDHPVVVFDRDGNLLRTFGEGVFSDRPHGIHTGPDDSVYCVDDGLHTIQKFTLDGKLLMTLGSPNQPAPKWQGKPFNRPTHVAVSRVTGHLYVSDGYGNSRIHKFTPEGRLVAGAGTTSRADCRLASASPKREKGRASSSRHMVSPWTRMAISTWATWPSRSGVAT